MTNYFKRLFLPYPLSNSRLESLHAFWWRVRGCNHDCEQHIDCGDEEHIWVYCFRCCSKT